MPLQFDDSSAAFRGAWQKWGNQRVLKNINVLGVSKMILFLLITSQYLNISGMKGTFYWKRKPDRFKGRKASSLWETKNQNRNFKEQLGRNNGNERVRRKEKGKETEP